MRGITQRCRGQSIMVEVLASYIYHIVNGEVQLIVCICVDGITVLIAMATIVFMAIKCARILSLYYHIPSIKSTFSIIQDKGMNVPLLTLFTDIH